MTQSSIPITTRTVAVRDLAVNVAIAGEGPALLLLHGFPHTWEVWEPIIPELAKNHTVIAPDLRGLGLTTRTAGGYGVRSLVDDAVGLLDALSVETAQVAGIDLGGPVAFLLAHTFPERISRLVVMEALIGTLPGAEAAFRAGPPWWFGFHMVPGFAETVLTGHEAEYVDFFLTAGSAGDGVTPTFRDAVVRGYTGTESLRSAFEYYRAFPDNAAVIAEAVAAERLTVPTLIVGGSPVGGVTFAQVEPFADDVVGHLIPGSAHIIPQHRPAELLAVMAPFLAP